MIKILVYCPVKADATSFYRGWGPLNHLARLNKEIELIDAGIPGYEFQWDVMMRMDLLFIQRPSTAHEVHLMRIAKQCGVPIWIDYDDDYLNIPETNPRFHLYGDPHRREQIKRCIQLADTISVSTISLIESITTVTGKPKEAFVLIQNAVDETRFEVDAPKKEDIGQGRDVILWRGGDTHNEDLQAYLDKMVELYNAYPGFTWAFVGHAPEAFLKRIDNKRIKLYPWTDIFSYFDFLFEIQPKITIVPWEDTLFNRSKSNIAWEESTLAGAVTLFPKFSTEFVEGMVGYNDAESFYAELKNLMITDVRDKVLESFATLKNRFTLKKTFDLRHYTIYRLLEGQASKPKLGYRAVQVITAAPLSDDGHYNNAVENKLTQDHEDYKKGYIALGKFLLERYHPNSVMEFGPGPGALMEIFLDCKVEQVVGLDINPIFKAYFDQRNPHYRNAYALGDCADLKIEGCFDLGVAIEVFHLLPEDTIEPLLKYLSEKFRHFYFSASPYHGTLKTDIELGHCTIWTYERWKDAWERNGWKYISNPIQGINHDMLLESATFSSPQA